MCQSLTMFASFKDDVSCFLGLIFGILTTSLYKPFSKLLTFRFIILCGFDYERIKHSEKLNIVTLPLSLIFQIDKQFFANTQHIKNIFDVGYFIIFKLNLCMTLDFNIVVNTTCSLYFRSKILFAA
jgi:hypothetical protein